MTEEVKKLEEQVQELEAEVNSAGAGEDEKPKEDEEQNPAEGTAHSKPAEAEDTAKAGEQVPSADELEKKRLQDKYAAANGAAEAMRKILKHEVDEGVIDLEEAAQKAGVSRSRIQGWLEKGTSYSPIDEKAAYFDDAWKEAKSFYDAKYGVDTNELVENYRIYAQQLDPSETDALAQVPNAALVDYVLDKGHKVGSEVKAVREQGSVAAYMRQLQKRVQELEAQKQNAQPESPASSEKPMLNGGTSYTDNQFVGGEKSFYENL